MSKGTGAKPYGKCVDLMFIIIFFSIRMEVLDTKGLVIFVSAHRSNYTELLKLL